MAGVKAGRPWRDPDRCLQGGGGRHESKVVAAFRRERRSPPALDFVQIEQEPANGAGVAGQRAAETLAKVQRGDGDA